MGNGWNTYTTQKATKWSIIGIVIFILIWLAFMGLIVGSLIKWLFFV